MGSIASRQNNVKDFFEIAREAITAELIQSYIPGLNLSGDGQELTGCSPYRDDKHPSFSINTGTGAWFDFATGDGGSFIDLVARIEGLEPLEAAKLIAGEANFQQNRVSFTRPKRPKPAGIDAEKADLLTLKGKLTSQWHRDNRGTLQTLHPYPLDIPPWPFVVARFEKDGGKLTIPYYLTEDGWVSGYPPEYQTGGRPLYRRGGAGSLWAGKVFIVEGEKCVDAIVKHSGAVAITWAGGCNAVDKSDWTLLQGGNIRITLWPDNDEAGLKAMEKIAGILRGLGCED